MQIIPLSEGSFTIDKSKLFVPFNTHSDDLQRRGIGSLLVEIQPFAVITSEDVLLLDTGLVFYVPIQYSIIFQQNDIRSLFQAVKFHRNVRRNAFIKSKA